MARAALIAVLLFSGCAHFAKQREQPHKDASPLAVPLMKACYAACDTELLDFSFLADGSMTCHCKVRSEIPFRRAVPAEGT